MYVYSPLIRTRMSELKALSNLDLDNLDNFIPIIELTKSNRIKTDDKKLNPITDRQFKKVSDIFQSKPFILDISRYDDLIGSDAIDFLYHQDNGMFKYINKLLEYKEINPNFIPMLQLKDIHNSKISGDNIKAQINHIKNNFSSLALRLDAYSLSGEMQDDYICSLINAIVQSCKDKINMTDIFFIIDFKYEEYDNLDINLNKIETLWKKILDVKGLSNIIMLEGVYPKNLKNMIVVEDSVKEKQLNKIPSLYKKYLEIIPNLIYGDYARVHPIYAQGGGSGNPIPAKVELSSIDSLIVSRYYVSKSNKELIYRRAAKSLLDFNDRNGTIPFDANCWSIKEVILASEGNLDKKINQSHWSAVRIHNHMYNTCRFLKEGIC